jgi:hypothetical protein
MTMFVVFWTMKTDNPDVFYDTWNVVDDEITAQKLLDEILERDNTYAAGIGPITNSSEHWHVQH